MYNETYEIERQHEEIRKIMNTYGYVEGKTFDIIQTDTHIRIHIGGAIEPAFLKVLEENGFNVLFMAADFPNGMFIAVKKDD